MCFVGSYLLGDSGVKGCGGWDYGGNWRRNLKTKKIDSN